MKHYVQKTIRLAAEKAELVEKIRIAEGVSWSGIAEIAFDALLEKRTLPAEPKKVNNTEPKIALLSEKKAEQKEEKSSPTEPNLTLDMSKLNLSLGEDDNAQI